MITENQFFDPAYMEVDRILSTTEIFPIVHPKKGSEIKGKWCESLVTVVSKLLNFVKNNIKYGVYFMEPVNPEKDGCPNYRRVIA
jgi:chromodomain-helicase-DNA-binding protein 7